MYLHDVGGASRALASLVPDTPADTEVAGMEGAPNSEDWAFASIPKSKNMLEKLNWICWELLSTPRTASTPSPTRK